MLGDTNVGEHIPSPVLRAPAGQGRQVRARLSRRRRARSTATRRTSTRSRSTLIAGRPGTDAERKGRRISGRRDASGSNVARAPVDVRSRRRRRDLRSASSSRSRGPVGRSRGTRCCSSSSSASRSVRSTRSPRCGLVVTYTTSGIFNFAQGAMGMFCAFIYWELKVNDGVQTVRRARAHGARRRAAHRRADRAHLHAAPRRARPWSSQLVVTIGLMLFLIGLAVGLWDPNSTRSIGTFFGTDGFQHRSDVRARGTGSSRSSPGSASLVLGCGSCSTAAAWVSRCARWSTTASSPRSTAPVRGSRRSSRGHSARRCRRSPASSSPRSSATLSRRDAHAVHRRRVRGRDHRAAQEPPAHVRRRDASSGSRSSFQQNFLTWSGRWSSASVRRSRR